MVKLLVLGVLVFSGGSAWAVNDPMRPPFFDGSSSQQRVQPSEPLVLSMVLFSNKRKVAVINGKSVRVGETVAGHRVLRIDANRVVVSRKGKVKEIPLGQPEQQNKTVINNQRAISND